MKRSDVNSGSKKYGRAEKQFRSVRILPAFVGLVFVLGSCATTGDQNSSVVEHQRRVQGTTQWSNNVSWWREETPRAIFRGDSFGAARSEPNAVIKGVYRENGGATRVVFQPIIDKYRAGHWVRMRNGDPIELIGASTLNRYLRKGQEVHLEFDNLGRILRFGTMMILRNVERRRAGDYHIELASRKSGATFSLLVGRKQLFQGYHDQIISKAREIEIFDNTPIRTLNTLGHEVIYTSSGIMYFSGSEYGAPPPVQSRWVAARVDDEGF